MHRKHIIHRDIKLQNLLLAVQGDDLDLRIADFGLSDFIPADGAKLTRRCGSPGYSAPEMLKGLGYNEKADIFSIGSVMYNLLTGRALFPGKNLKAIL